MAIGEHTSVDPGLMRALARHLEHLKSCPGGSELYQLINEALRYCREHGYVNGSSVAYLHGLVHDYTQDHTQPSPVRVRAHLIQQHLALYLPPAERVASVTHVKPPTADSAGGASAKAPPSAPLSTDRRQARASAKPTVTSAVENRRSPEEKPVPTAEKAPTSTSNKAQSLEELRQVLTKGMDELLREREALAKQLSDANSYLKMIEAEREQLRDELNKVRRRTRPADKSTKKLGLPKRDVLLRQIESEVERVKRHGSPLALALIDIDDLETIDSQHGQEAARAALDRYTSEILGSFRSYDLVARYNKDEFAVLLPNTDKENAARALEKIRKRASESHFSHKGRSYPLPGFGGVLTFYSPGEEPQQMLRRADEALVNLKLKGQRQVVVV